MKVKTSELTGKALDWAVAKGVGHLESTNDRMLPRVVVCGDTLCNEVVVRLNPLPDVYYDWWYAPSTNWAQGGPIIEQEGISIVLDWDIQGEFSWTATRIEGSSVSEAQGPTPLIAAMRCFVAGHLGDEIEIPEELK